jgi:hypothetical protein
MKGIYFICLNANNLPLSNKVFNSDFYAGTYTEIGTYRKVVENGTEFYFDPKP